MRRDKKKPDHYCPECRHYHGDHGVNYTTGELCSRTQDWEATAKRWFKTAQGATGRADRYRKQTTLWQGKFAIVVRENNALRKALRKLDDAD